MASLKKPKLIRVVTFPISFRFLLRGQLKFMANTFEILGIASPLPELAIIQKEENVPTLGIPLSRKITPFRDFLSLIAMVRVFWHHKPDIVHSHTPKAGLIAMMAAWITRVPHRIHTVAGMPLMVTTGTKRTLLVWIERLTAACATVVIPNSKGLKSYIQDHRLCATRKLHFFEPGSSNGIPMDYFCRTPDWNKTGEILRQTLGLEDRIVFLFAGRIVQDKGIEELTEAFVRLHAENPTVFWLVAGDFDHGLNQISPQTKHLLHTHPAIHLMGFIPDIRLALSASTVLVLPSYREGLPQVLLQACAMEVPCITTDIMGCNEVISHEHNGLIVPPQNAEALYAAMSKLCTNPTLLEAVTTNARPSVEPYNQNAIWTQLLGFYQTLLKG